MSSTSFHHRLDQFRALRPSRQRRIRVAIGGLGVVAVAGLGAACGRGFGSANGLAARAQRPALRNRVLGDELQGLKQQPQTRTTALATLRNSLARRDSELQQSKQEQAFYAKLIGLDGDRARLGIHSLALAPVRATGAWNFIATLVNTAERGEVANGVLTIAVEAPVGGRGWVVTRRQCLDRHGTRRHDAWEAPSMNNASTTIHGPAITISAAARARVRELTREQGNPALKLRVSVDGGGCSGFQYRFSIEVAPADNDVVLDGEGSGLVVDRLSLPYLEGAEVDYIDQLSGSQFVVHNPNAKTTCGCGSSFTA